MTSIRPGEPGDLPRLRAIQTATLAEPAPDLLAAAAEPGPPELFVAVNGEPVGYALLVAGEDAYLPELAVAPAGQSQGVGTALLDAVLAAQRDRADGPDRLRVTAQAGDERVRQFSERNGFEAAERLPNFFEAGAGVAMVREL